MHQNKTQKQHYVSRAEQRLNAINPSAELDNQRIYVFAIENRSALVVLSEAREVKIANTLAWQDLFSFDVPQFGSLRSNFERLFGRYESQVVPATTALLNKLDNCDLSIKAELEAIFYAKYMNLLRNPYSVEQNSGLLDILDSHRFTDPNLAREYETVYEGNKPHLRAVANKFGFTEEGYRSWLRALFLAFRPFGDGTSVFEICVNRFFSNSIAKICVGRYSEECCLLSDRGGNVFGCEEEFREPFGNGTLVEGHNFGAEFNLTKNAFVRYMFLFGDSFTQPVGELGRSYFHCETDNMRELAVYNRETVWGSHSVVFCAGRTPLLSLEGQSSASTRTISTWL